MSVTTVKTKYYCFTEDLGKHLRAAKLSGAEWAIWSYLALLDPFGDGYQSLPSMVDVMRECGVSKTTFYRAIARLQELELFDFQASILFRNLSGVKSQNWESGSESGTQAEPESGIECWNRELSAGNVTDFPNLGLDSRKCNGAYIDRARIQTIHNYSDYSHSPESESAVGDSEGGASDPVSEPEQINLPGNSEKPETAEDLHPPSSATPPSSVVAFEARMRGGNLEPWELSSKRFDYEPGFVQFLVKVYLPEVPSYQKQIVTIDKAQAWLNGAKYNEQRKDLALLQWERYQKSLQVQDEPVCHPFREFRPAQPTETVSLAQYAAQFRQRLVGGGE